MGHNKCTVKLNDLIDNLNNESCKKICRNIGNYVISITDDKIDNFYRSLSKSNKHISTNTNEYILRRHFFLKVLEDVNNELSKNNAGFVFDVSDEVYDYFEVKIVDHITPSPKRT